MSVEVRVPPMGESVVEATVGRWLKAEGDAVQAGDSIVELETEKISLQVPAEEGGVLEKIVQPEGEIVHVGDLLATLANGTAASAAAAPLSTQAPMPTAQAPAPTVEVPTP